MSSLSALTNNAALVALVGSTLTAGALYQLREIPKKLGNLLRDQFSITLKLHNSDEIYRYFDTWIGQKDRAKGKRRLLMAENYQFDKGEWEWQYTLGEGYHVIRDNGYWYLLYRSFTENQTLLGTQRSASIEIITFGRNQDAIRSLIEQAKTVYDGQREHTRVFCWSGDTFQLVDYKRKRSLDTIYIPAAQKARITADLDRFTAENAKDAYVKRGTPYRRGYCFEGPPGTGKTSIILALAGYVNRDVYIINPTSVGGDAGLQRAINAVDNNGFAVVEDIDTISITKSREATPDKKPDSEVVVNASDKPALTLSGLLNAIDGIASRDGRILCITTNHSNTLDAALMRPGRIDVRETIGLMHEPEARAMFSSYFAGEASDWFDANVLPTLPASPASVQNMLISRSDSTHG